MITWLTWRIGVFILVGALTAAAGGWLYDGISNRVEIRLLRGDRDALSKTVETMNQNIGTCHANVTNLTGGLKAVRDDIDKAAKESKARDDTLQANMKQAAKQAKGDLDLATKNLMKPSTTPVGTLLSCQTGESIFRGKVP